MTKKMFIQYSKNPHFNKLRIISFIQRRNWPADTYRTGGVGTGESRT